MIKTKNSLIGTAFLTAIISLFNNGTDTTLAQDKSLYQRLGGYDAIAMVVDDFVMQLASDESLGVFFKGHSQDSLNKIRQHVIDFICQAAGGPCKYTGRDMNTSHKGMGITEEHWNKSVDYLVNTLNKFKVGQTEQSELLAAVSSVKADIVDDMEAMK